MRILTKPDETGHYWWLPQYCFEKNQIHRRYWSIEFCTKDTDLEGVFVGPIEFPIVFIKTYSVNGLTSVLCHVI